MDDPNEGAIAFNIDCCSCDSAFTCVSAIDQECQNIEFSWGFSQD